MNGPFPEKLTWRWVRVWQRNWSVYVRGLPIRFLIPILEPILYIVAFGWGLGSFVGNVPYLGKELSYIAFIAPGIIAVAIMFQAFFENTYASFVRMYYQKTFDAMLATPLVIEEVITAEIAWGATLSVMAACIVTTVVSFFGLLTYPDALFILPLAAIGGFVFGSLAMCFTAVVPTIELFNVPIFLLVTPMFLFSGTFFPLESLPVWGQKIALIFPLTHLVYLVRSLCMGIVGSELMGSVVYLLVFGAVFFFLGLVLMRRRLIK